MLNFQFLVLLTLTVLLSYYLLIGFFKLPLCVLVQDFVIK